MSWRAKIFVVCVGLVLGAVLAAEIYLAPSLRTMLTEKTAADLEARADLAAHALTQASAPAGTPLDAWRWDALAHALGKAAHARVSLIRPDGVVLGDSELSAESSRRLENHRERPEVAAALAGRRGMSIRYSATLSEPMMYVAVPAPCGEGSCVVRMALPLGDVDAAVTRMRRTVVIAGLFGILLAVVAATVAAERLSRAVRLVTAAAARMAAGDLSSRTRVRGKDEVATIGAALDGLAEALARTMSELAAERDLLDSVLGSMREGVLLLGADGRVLLFNAALREMLLIDSSASGKPLLEVVRNAELKQAIEGAGVEDGGAVAREVQVAGLRPRQLLVYVTPLAKGSGRVAVIVDVTRERQLESVRRDFVANVSHELRTPVTAMRSAAETLETALGDPAAARRFLAMIQRNADRLTQLVADLLELSRLDAREYRLEVADVALAPCVERTFALFECEAQAKRVALLSEVAPDVAIRADQRALEQVLTNLVGNAVKYCVEATQVTVRATGAGAMIRIAVVDGGPGIEPRHLPRLFERFFRVDPGRSREVGGTGLGLAIVKHLTEAMGGRVGVESVVGKGSTFTVTLPRATSAP